MAPVGCIDPVNEPAPAPDFSGLGLGLGLGLVLGAQLDRAPL